MNKLYNNLEKYARNLNVKSIMIPEIELICANTKSEALSILNDNDNFDLVPIRNNSGIHAYIDRQNDKVQKIQCQDVLSDSTPILDLISLMNSKSRLFYFIKTNNKISGYVHFSDLNNSIVKIPFFLLFEAIETKLIQILKGTVTIQELKNILDKERLDKVTRIYKKQKEKNTDLNIFSLIYFSEILKYANSINIINFKGKYIDEIKNIRNLVCHATEPIIKIYKDINKLERVHDNCIEIIRKLDCEQ